MVESTTQNKSQEDRRDSERKGVHFDEQELFEYDKTRGQCMKIDDPKTPYHEYSDEDEEINEN